MLSHQTDVSIFQSHSLLASALSLPLALLHFFVSFYFSAYFFVNTGSLLWYGSHKHPHDAPYAKRYQAKVQQCLHPAHLERSMPPGYLRVHTDDSLLLTHNSVAEQ